MELIISRDYRKFMEEKNIELSDWDKATLIYNHTVASFPEKIKELIELCEQTQDEDLIKQIKERMAQEVKYVEQFKENTGNAYYQLAVLHKGKYDWDEVYLDYDSVFEAGMSEGTPFAIKKECLACKEAKGDNQGTFGSITYNVKGNVEKIGWLYCKGDMNEIRYNKKRFEDRYVDLPMCFRQGDIVKIVGTELYGIIDGIVDDADEERHCRLGRSGDYSDYQITVNLFYNDKKFLSVFSHDHIPPTEIEYARFEEGDSRQGILEYMKRALYHNSLWSGIGRDPRRIKEVLIKIETVWKQYPDLRLGQLLLNVCGSRDLFMVEDEKLLERLEKNIFPIED